MKPKEYRSDIDGLRAIAVMSVFIHHLNNTLLPGGFVGVDIFFVISGYLITSNIYHEIKGGSFLSRQFYKRRINRIVPALLTMVASCMVVAPFLLSPTDLTNFTSSAFLSLVGLSNFFFWREYGNYFAQDAAEAVLLHTWTLGVEEQFYVIWPLVLLLLVSLAPRRLLVILAGLTIIAIGVSEYGTTHFAKAAYYLLPTRLFELLTGGVLAVFVTDRPQHRYFHASVFAVVGYALILFALFNLNKESSFPGLNALAPCVGSALLIWAGTDGEPSRILSNRVMVFLGLISYSLYLWHWPIIAYVNYLGIPIGLAVALGIIAISILLAWASWRYVEVPFRSSGASLMFRRVLTIRLAIPVIMLFLVAAVCLRFNGFPQRFDPIVSSFDAMVAAKPNEIRSRCHASISQYGREPNPACRLGAEKDYVDGILLGDSYANHFTGMVDVLAKADGITIIDYTMDACPPILGYASALRASYAEKCALRNAHVFSLLDQRRYRYVILSADWPSDDQARGAIESSLARIIAAGSQPIVILSNQKIERAASCPLKRLMFGLQHSCAAPQADAPHYWASVGVEYPEARFIDPNEAICFDRSCSPVIGRTLLYRDNGHLNEFGSRLIGRILSERGRSLVHDRR